MAEVQVYDCEKCGTNSQYPADTAKDDMTCTACGGTGTIRSVPGLLIEDSNGARTTRHGGSDKGHGRKAR